LLRTGVPVEGRLQARLERRRGLHVPRDVIEASVNIVGKTKNIRMTATRCPDAPCGGGDRLPFIGQGEGDLQACRTISLRVAAWRIVPRS
jgi:hypothetical protein